MSSKTREQQSPGPERYMKLVNKAMATAPSSGTNYGEELKTVVDAHNAAAHTVTKIHSEEVMMGRKIRQRLPLLVGEKSITTRTLSIPVIS